MKRPPKTRCFHFAVVTALMLIFTGHADAQKRWSLRRLNPLYLLPEPELKWPSWAKVKLPEVELLPDWIKLPPAPNIPEELEKLHRTTKRNLIKTANSLNPFYEKPVPLVHRAPTGSRKKTTRTSGSAAESSRFWFPSFMLEDQRQGSSRTMHEFLERPRPGR